MRVPPSLVLTQAALALTAPLDALANGNINEPLTSISAYSDLRPSDWAYRTLSTLIERTGCVAGYTNASFAGGRDLSRFEAAALLHSCLDRITEGSDARMRLMTELERELASLKGRADGLEARVGELEANGFSPTTKLSGLATFVLGSNRFSGSANALVKQNTAVFAATTFNADLRLTLDTSFTGKDLLRTTLRAGNFDAMNSSFGGGGPSSLSVLETAFQEDLVNGGGADVVGIDRLFYQVPLGDFTVTVGGRVEQDDMLAIWPSVYPAETVLDVFTLAGAPAAYNNNLGAGAGFWWRRNGWAVSANYVASNGNSSNPCEGGIATPGAGSTGTLQIGYSTEQWAIAALYARVQNGKELIPYGTNFTLESFNNAGSTSATAVSGYWQPSNAGWIPSISVGWGLNSTRYTGDADDDAGLVATSQSWSVGLQWQDAFFKGHVLGMAAGQPTFATSLQGGATPNDGTMVWEWWYRVQLSDAISITPAVFLLSRPLGADTPAGESFRQLGALIKTSFRF